MTQDNATQEQHDRETEFQLEKEHLGAVVGSIDASIEHKEGLVKPGRINAGDVKAADKVKALAHIGLDELKGTRNNPYFGRVDYSDADGTEKSIYIGNINVNNFDNPQYFIANHNAPIAQLFYNPGAGKFVIKKDGNRVREDIVKEAKVYLTRSLSIEHAELLDFEDTLSLPTPRMLTQRLSGPSTGQMSNAVDTLQPTQYAALSRTDSPVLIVQGAAGSGKSIVALQRIAFMLSPFSDIGNLDRPTTAGVIMFGPSPAFLKYVSGMLPGLDVQNVRQTTITEWMLGQFSPGSRVTLKGGEERVFNDLMSTRRFGKIQVQAHLFKGSLKMKRLLDNYVRELTRNHQRNVLRQAGNIISRLSLNISIADFRNRVDNAFSTRPELNAARASLIDGLAELMARTLPPPIRRRNSPQSEIIAAHRKAVEQEIGYPWPFLDFRSEYVRLISGPDVILNYSKSALDWNAANEICQTVPRNSTGRSLGLTDLAAALYLDYALNGFTDERQRENFEHVVVDEAQDVSPLEMELLRIHSLNDSFTILGDLKQGLLPHRSITNWNEFAKLFEKDSVARAEMQLAYRSTKQVTQYANRILKDLPKRTAKTPQPYGRSGTRPELVRSKSAQEMYQSIADAVEKLRDFEDVRSIAVLTKWESAAKDILKEFRSERIEGASRLEEGGLIETDIVVTPIVLTKGLEFDAVIVANAGKNNFNETEFDRMLLYLACTRARHHLEMHWHGTRSPIVPVTERLAR